MTASLTVILAICISCFGLASLRRVGPVQFPEECSDVPLCRMYCPNGYLRDARGCALCACRPFSGAGGSSRCPLAMCMMYCPNGFQKGADGCPLCKCKPQPDVNLGGKCPLWRCNMYCPNGFQTLANGCSICRCKPFPGLRLE